MFTCVALSLGAFLYACTSSQPALTINAPQPQSQLTAPSAPLPEVLADQKSLLDNALPALSRRNATISALPSATLPSATGDADAHNGKETACRGDGGLPTARELCPRYHCDLLK